jgi:K+-sensing histidine kinase KdpD
VALDDRTTDEQADALAHIATSVDQTCRLIEGLLTLARGDSRELDPRLRDFDLSAVVAEVAEIGTLMCGDKQVTVSATCAPGFMAHGDASTRQILLNFVSTLPDIPRRDRSMTLRRENDAALAEVSDWEWHRPSTCRASSAAYRDSRAAGPVGGLDYDRRALAEAQRGDVRAESVEGSGSTFVLDLPSDRAQWEARGRQALA